jgi:hypothetical protein
VIVMSDWSPAEDLRPAIPLLKEQPEKSPRGDVWTQVVVFPWPAPGYTQMTIRDCSGEYRIGHGRVYPLDIEAEDGA